MKKPFNHAAVELAKALPEERRADFLRYTTTGEAEPPFLNWLENDKHARAAAEMMFDKTAKALENLGRYVRSTGGKPLFDP